MKRRESRECHAFACSAALVLPRPSDAGSLFRHAFSIVLHLHKQIVNHGMWITFDSVVCHMPTPKVASSNSPPPSHR
jgi:hypothetical protein